jgi:hypothetical protein
LTVRERTAQDKLQALGEDKKTQEHLLDSTWKMLSERNYSSSIVISSAVACAVALLKSYVSDLDDEWDALKDSLGTILSTMIMSGMRL